MGIIYCIRNRTDGKRYVGKTSRTPEERWAEHIQDAERGSRTYFHRAIRKHGATGFEVTVLAELGEVNGIDRLEKQWIAALDTCDPISGYNCTSGGTGGAMTGEAREKLRRPKSLEHRQKISAMAKARGTAHMNTPESRLKKSVMLKGRVFSAETIAKMSAAKAGKPRQASPEALKRLSERMSGSGNPMYGKAISEEARKRSVAGLRRWLQSDAGLAFSRKRKQIKLAAACAGKGA